MRNITLTLHILLILICVLPGSVLSQSTGSALVPDAVVIDFSDDEVVEIVGSVENVRRTEESLRQADLALRGYLRASMDAIMQGHQEGFALFDNWYRHRDARLRREAAQKETVAKICGQALSQGLNFAIPGSGVFVSALRSGLTLSYTQAASQINAFEGGDPDLFISAQRQAIESIRSSFLAQADTMPGEEPEAFDTLKWEYLFDVENSEGTSSDLSPFMRRLALQFGIPAPDASTIERTKLTVLENHMRAVFEADERFMKGYGVSEFNRRSAYVTAAARSNAYRHAFAGQPNKYCPIEVELYGLGILGAGSECRKWQSVSR